MESTKESSGTGERYEIGLIVLFGSEISLMLSFLTSESFLKLLTSIAILAAAIIAAAKSFIELKAASLKLKSESTEIQTSSQKLSPRSTKIFTRSDKIVFILAYLLIAYFFIFPPFTKWSFLVILALWTIIFLLVVARFNLMLLNWVLHAFFDIHENLKLQTSHLEATEGIVSILEKQSGLKKEGEPETNPAEQDEDGKASPAIS